MKFTTFLISFFILALIFQPIIFLIWLITIPFDRQRKITHKATRLWSSLIYKLRPFWKVDVIGLENVDPNRTYLITPNHQNLMDIPLVMRLPLDLRWVSKKEVYKMPFAGWTLWLRGDVAIERGGVASAKKMIKDCSNYINKNISIVIFPEGTRTKDGTIGKFHTGAFMLVKRIKQPILPVVIHGNFDCFNDNKPLRQTITLRILPAVEPEVFENLTLEETTEYLRAIITTEYDKICQQHQK